MLSCAGSSRRTHTALPSQQGRSQVQLVLPFIEIEEQPAPAVVVWEALDPEERATVLAILTKLMVKAVIPKEVGDE
jgi:hypothetical protein